MGEFCLCAGLFDYRDGPRAGKDGLYRVLLGSGIIYWHEKDVTRMCVRKGRAYLEEKSGSKSCHPVNVGWTDVA